MRLSNDEKASLYEFHLITSKPVMYIANVNEDGFENNPHLDTVNRLAVEEGAVVVPICAAIESGLIELELSIRWNKIRTPASCSLAPAATVFINCCLTPIRRLPCICH